METAFSALRPVRPRVGAGTALVKRFYRRILIVRIVLDKKIQVEYPAKPHEPGLHHDQKNSIEAHPPEEPGVFRRQADTDPPQEKSSDRQAERKEIADVAGAIPESDLELEMLFAFRTFFRHGQRLAQLPGIGVAEHRPPAASGAFHGEETPDIIRFFGRRHRAVLNWKNEGMVLPPTPLG